LCVSVFVSLKIIGRANFETYNEVGMNTA